ncbi:MAG: hypothetical protein WAW09_04630, partial [Smithella sp.]
YLQKLPICHFDRREKSYSMIIKISQSLRSFEMTRLILKSSTSLIKKNNNIFKVARVLQGGIHGIAGIGSYSLPEFTI